MKKLESTFPNMIIVLSLVSIVSAFALGYTYSITKHKIAEVAKQKQENAVKFVLPSYDNNPFDEKLVKADGLEIYTAKSQGEIVGYAVKTFTDKGFSGRIEVMAGFDANKKLVKVSLLKHNETPGLGSKMGDEPFVGQFSSVERERFPLSVKKDGGTVDSITAATISSRAYLDALNRASSAIVVDEKGTNESQLYDANSAASSKAYQK